MRVTAGVDFGGTNIKIGLVTPRGQVRHETIVPTRTWQRPAAFVEGLAMVVTRMLQREHRRCRLEGIGIGAPGLIDATRGRIHRLVNVPGGWEGIALGRLVSRRMRCVCVVDNDANVVALGEWRFGAGRGATHVVMVTLGTGVGGGLIVEGRLVRGAAGSAGEIGHVPIRPDGPRCGCGSRGCVEAFVGTRALRRRTRALIRQHPGSVLARFVARERQGLTPELLSRAARAGDRHAQTLWREVGMELGQALAGVVNLLNPERIIIGGGVANAWPWFAPSLRRTVRARAFAVPAAAARIVNAQLGDQAGVVGAASLVWEHREVA